MSGVNETIDYLQCYTKDNIMNINNAKIPLFVPNDDITMKRYYTLNGERCIVSEANKTLIVLSNIRFHVSERKRELRTFKKPLLDLINGGLIDTFILFINKKFIKWSNIEIVRDSRYIYAIISNTVISSISSIDVLYIPFKVVYSEKYIKKIEGLTTIFAFTEEGLSSAYGPINISISSDNVVYYKNMYSGGGAILNTNLDLDTRLVSSAKNIVLFKDNLLYSEAKVDVSKLNTVTVDDGALAKYELKLFYNPNSYIPYNNINNIKNIDLIKYMSVLEDDKSKFFIDALMRDFNFEFDNSKPYSENISNIIDYIMTYNESLMNFSYFQDEIFFREITPDEMRSFISNGKLKMPRYKATKNGETYVLFYKNNMVYNKYNTITYDIDNFYIDMELDDILDSDNFEAIYFKNVYNEIQDVVIESENSFIGDYPIPKINSLFFTDSPEVMEFDINSENIRYLVGSVYDDKISILSDYYFNKHLFHVSNRQFRSYCETITEDSDSVFRIALPADFNYCISYKNYLIFINGRLVDQSNYTIGFMTNLNPINKTTIYLHSILKVGDVVNIVYTPITFNNIETSSYVSATGYIKATGWGLEYPFSKELCAIFINGKKIFKSQLQDIDYKTVKVMEDIKTRSEITILKFLWPNYALKDKLGSSIWSYLVENSTDSDINALIEHYGTLSDEEIKRKFNLDEDMILRELYRDYWLKPGINKGIPFKEDPMYCVDSISEDVEYAEGGSIHNIDIQNANINANILE